MYRDKDTGSPGQEIPRQRDLSLTSAAFPGTSAPSGWWLRLADTHFGKATVC